MFSIILGVMVLFGGVCVYYLWSNDWAKETADVIIPILGAFFLTGYAFVKLFILDAPDSLKFSDVIAIHHNTSTGFIQGVPNTTALYQKNEELIKSLYEFRGITWLRFPILSDVNRTTYHFIAELKKPVEFVPYPFGINYPPVIVNNIVEYGFLEWLSFHNDLLIGAATEYNDWTLISSARALVKPPEDLVTVITKGRDLEKNPILQALPLTLKLPKNSLVGRDLIDTTAIFLKTPHSTLTVKIIPVGTEKLQTVEMKSKSSQQVNDPNIEKLRKLYSRLLGESSTEENIHFLYAYRFEFEFKQNADVRFSKQAKKEAKWAIYLQRQFQKDFSWSYLSQRVLQ